MVLLDDVHRADAATRTLLLDLARAVAGRPVLLLFTAVQSEELSSLGTVSPTTSLDGEAEDFLVALGAAAGSSLTAMELKPLRVAQTTELIGSMLGVLYDEARELADWIAGIAGGNPLRVVQLVRWLEQTGAITRSPEGWQLSMERVRQSELPEDLVDTIRVAVTGLEDPTRRVLAAAALHESKLKPVLLPVRFGKVDQACRDLPSDP